MAHKVTDVGRDGALLFCRKLSPACLEHLAVRQILHLDGLFATNLMRIADVQLYWRRAMDHTFDQTLHGFRLVARESEEFPLIQRKWCFQERMLARRMVYFKSHEFIWECKTETTCECGEHKYPWGPGLPTHKIGYNNQLAKLKVDLAESSDLDALLLAWTRLVREYTVRRLTVADDVLPAFSGVASTFARPAIGRYMGGTWYNTLPSALCWSALSHGVNELYGSPLSRSKEYCAPRGRGHLCNAVLSLAMLSVAKIHGSTGSKSLVEAARQARWMHSAVSRMESS